jgi:hypothetical protein
MISSKKNETCEYFYRSIIGNTSGQTDEAKENKNVQAQGQNEKFRTSKWNNELSHNIVAPRINKEKSQMSEVPETASCKRSTELLKKIIKNSYNWKSLEAILPINNGTKLASRHSYLFQYINEWLNAPGC